MVIARLFLQLLRLRMSRTCAHGETQSSHSVNTYVVFVFPRAPPRSGEAKEHLSQFPPHLPLRSFPRSRSWPLRSHLPRLPRETSSKPPARHPQTGTARCKPSPTCQGRGTAQYLTSEARRPRLSPYRSKVEGDLHACRANA